MVSALDFPVTAYLSALGLSHVVRTDEVGLQHGLAAQHHAAEVAPVVAGLAANRDRQDRHAGRRKTFGIAGGKVLQACASTCTCI